MPPQDPDLRINSRIVVPIREIAIRRSRSSGPGGQHSNVTESRVEAVFDVSASTAFSDEQKLLIIAKLGPVVTAVSQDQRSQLRNRELALTRLAEKLKLAIRRPKPRRSTTPSRGAQERRLQKKQQQSEKKQRRRPLSED